MQVFCFIITIIINFCMLRIFLKLILSHIKCFGSSYEVTFILFILFRYPRYFIPFPHALILLRADAHSKFLLSHPIFSTSGGFFPCRAQHLYLSPPLIHTIFSLSQHLAFTHLLVNNWVLFLYFLVSKIVPFLFLLLYITVFSLLKMSSPFLFSVCGWSSLISNSQRSEVTFSSYFCTFSLLLSKYLLLCRKHGSSSPFNILSF